MVNNVVVISDEHCGSRLGLCPPIKIPLDNGYYYPSALQEKVWAWWDHLWKVDIPELTHGEPFCVVNNGDALEGKPFNSSEAISDNMEDQRALAKMILEPIKRMCATDENGNHLFFMIRGTESHVGKSAEHEEALAKSLGAIPDHLGKHSQYEMFMRLDDNGPLINFKHHIGITGSTAYAATRPSRDYLELVYNSVMWGRAVPNIMVRSHRHKFLVLEPEGKDDNWIVVTPGWQLKTPYAHRITDDMPVMGAIVIRKSDERTYVTKRTWSIDRIPEVVI